MIKNDKSDKYGPAVDWWALGVFTYELMFGKLPFDMVNVSQTNEEISKLYKNGVQFPANSVIAASVECKNFIFGCLNNDPCKRLGSKKDMSEIFKHPWMADINYEELLNK